MREWAVRVFVAVVCVTGPASAETRLRPQELAQAATDVSGLRRLVTSPSEWLLGPASAGTPASRAAGNRPALSYSRLLGALVITRDLRLPGAPFMAFRLIPTRRALGGDLAVPIVLRPRLIATSWYGVDALVRF
jgi:hypothetical protein